LWSRATIEVAPDLQALRPKVVKRARIVVS